MPFSSFENLKYRAVERQREEEVREENAVLVERVIAQIRETFY